MSPADAMEIRERLHEAMLTCAGRSAFRFSVEEVAVEAGLSRATVYRYFPGGKDQLIADGVRWEVGRFFSRVVDEVADERDVSSKIATALVVGRHLLDEHDVLAAARQRGSGGPVRTARRGSCPSMPRGHPDAYVAELLGEEDAAPTESTSGEAADYVARLYLSYLGSQRVDLNDPDQVRTSCARSSSAGIVADVDHLRRLRAQVPRSERTGWRAVSRTGRPMSQDPTWQ